MITTAGKNVIKRYVAGQIPNIATAVAFGVGTAAPALTDTTLSYEVLRNGITSINADLANDRIVFKSNIVPGTIRTIYEVGLFSEVTDVVTSRTLSLLAPGVADWTNATRDSANARANAEALRIDYVANGTTNAELVGIGEDLSSFDATSTIVIAFYATTNLSSVRVRMGTDASNYFEFVMTSPTLSGYNIYRLARSAATVTGNPDWSAITYVAVRPTATAGGAGAIYFDGIRFEQNAAINSGILVARTVLETPVQVDTTIPSDVEYSLEINFT